MFGFSLRFVTIKRVANFEPNIVFGLEQNA